MDYSTIYLVLLSECDDEDELIAILAAMSQNDVSRSSPRFWMRDHFKARREGETMQSICSNNGIYFRNWTRISATDFEFILNSVAPIIIKEDTNFRQAISPELRLLVTLRYLATGTSFVELGNHFKISKQSISKIVPSVCDAIVQSLTNYVKCPTSQEEWLLNESEFNNKLKFPKCVGAIDGKHIVIQLPPHGASEYINYKGSHSIVLMAIVDANCKFIFANVGCQGRISDGGVFRNTSFYSKMANGELNLPNPTPLLGRNLAVPYVLLGDSAFALSPNLMKPYQGMHSNDSRETKFNLRLSSARAIVENAFGVLTAVFRVLRTTSLLKIDNVIKVVMTTIHLHNFRRRDSVVRKLYFNPGYLQSLNETSPTDSMGSEEFVNLQSSRTESQDANEIRREFANYFYQQAQ